MAQQWNPRQAMLEERFEMFHYQDRSVDVELHHHDFYEVYYFLSGNVSYSIEGESYHLLPGDVLLVAPEELHQPLVKPGEQYERYVLWIDRQYLGQLSAGGANLAACFQSDSPLRRRILRPEWAEGGQLRTLMQFLLRRPGQGGYVALEQQALVTALLSRLNSLCIDAPVIPPSDQPTDTMSQVLRYLEEHLTESITLEDLELRFYLSKYHLLREFRKCFGTTVHKYVLKRRLMQAKALLAQGCRPSGFYADCGFRDYASFYRAFVNEYGLSPRDYQSFVLRRR